MLFSNRDEDAEKTMSKLQILPHAGKPEHIGRAVVFLTSDETGHFTTGADLVIDGGVLLDPSFGRKNLSRL